MRELTPQQARTIQLDILDRVHTFCQKNGLRYSLGGGTLLGAIRHKGFIPWDDDIDIMMPRPDYDRFIASFRDTDPHLEIRDWHSSPHHILPFAKIYERRSQAIGNNRINDQAIFIDVFPIDGIPDTDTTRFINEVSECIDNLLRSGKYYLFGKNPAEKSILFLKYLLKRLRYPSRKALINRLETLLSTNCFDTSRLAGAIVGRYAEKECMPHDVFTSYTTLPFEDRSYMAIARWDEYLTKHYGDYMKLPPEDQRTGEHFEKIYWVE